MTLQKKEEDLHLIEVIPDIVHALILSPLKLEFHIIERNRFLDFEIYP